MEIKYNKDLMARARELRKKSTLSEILLWNQIKNKQIGFSFDRQQPVGNYIVDFLCRKERAIVEIDGDSHDGKAEYDEARDEYFKAQGLIVIHVHDYEVKKNMGGVLAFIQKNIKERTSAGTVARY